MALSRKWIFFLDKSLGRKGVGGIFPKVLRVEHFADIHGVTCPNFFCSYESPLSPHFLLHTRVALPNLHPRPLTAGIKNNIKN